MDFETRAIWPVELEVRQSGRVLSGIFRYGATATMSDRGRVRKEVFRARCVQLRGR